MGNHGKVQRVIRELVAILVEELGPEEAAAKLEIVAEQLRGASGSQRQAKAHENTAATVRPRIVANR